MVRARVIFTPLSLCVHPPALRFTPDWCKKLYNGAMVPGIIFVVDSTEFRPFLGALPCSLSCSRIVKQ